MHSITHELDDLSELSKVEEKEEIEVEEDL